MVKRQIVVLDDAGSSPVLLPNGLIVQLDRTSGYEPENIGSNPIETTNAAVAEWYTRQT